MRLYQKRFIRRRMERQVQRRIESRDAICWDILPAQRLCRVKIQGSNNLIVAYYPENWTQTPSWLKVNNAVRISHTGGIGGRIEVVGHGTFLPSPVGEEAGEGELEAMADVVLVSCNVIACPNNPQMAVLVKTGMYRIDESEITLNPITMQYGANFTMDMGGQVGTIAGAVAIDAAPGAGYFRYDLIALGDDGVIDYVKGNDFTTTQSIPSLPASHIELGRILLYAGMTEITQADINRVFTVPVASGLGMIIADDDLQWTELSTTVTLSVVDQYGNAILAGGYGWYLTLEIKTGNGTVTSAEEGDSVTKVGQHTGSSTHEYAFTYTRDQQDPGDVSPLLEGVAEITNPLTNSGRIMLRDAGGNPM